MRRRCAIGLHGGTAPFKFKGTQPERHIVLDAFFPDEEGKASTIGCHAGIYCYMQASIIGY